MLADQVRDLARVALADHAEKLIDQLRPKFEPAAARLHEIVSLGIGPTTPAHHVITLGDDAVQGWRDLPKSWAW